MTFRTLLCAIGIHSWDIIREVEYASLAMEQLAVPTQTKQRQCVHCKVIHEEDVHCLGLNPPEYVTTWFKIND